MTGVAKSSGFTGEFRFGRFAALAAERQLLADGQPAALGARAFDLLMALIEHRDRVLSKNELLELVWPGRVVEENNLQVHISALRKLLGPQAIATIPGRGYRFTAALDLAHTGPPAESTTVVPHNLPRQFTHFIGREAALAQCAKLLRDVRLLTLTGIGGCGKTRLALQLAHEQLAGFADGVWFVDLAPIQEPQRVAPALAAVLSVREQIGTPLLEQLASHLATRRVLIVLDNCEHVIDAVAQLVDVLLANCVELKVVATSREGLGVAGEQAFTVRPLSLPASTDTAAMQASEAVRLFIDRARLALPDFSLDEHNAYAIGEVCRRLDGIALAIELAAARVKLLAVEEIRARLDDRFRLLTGGNRALPRHQTLLATLQWSHDHLAEGEQRLLRQLSVFAGGCTLAAAAWIAESADEYAALEVLTHLHDKSLLIVDRDASAPRYRMLETVRQYAQQRLDEAGDAAAVRDRHLHYCVALAEEAGPQHGVWVVRLRLEQENLLAAHAWCEHAAGGGEAGLRLVAALARYWLMTAQLERGYRLALAALARATRRIDELLHCRTLAALALLEVNMGRFDDSLQHAQQSLALARAIDNAEAIATGLSLQATALHATGQHALALAQFDAALDIARSLGNKHQLGVVLNNIAEVHRSLGNVDAAERHYEESIAIARELQNPGRLAVSVSNLARLSVTVGKLDRARLLLRECLELSTVAALMGLGRHLLEVTAGLAAVQGDHRSAARFSGAAQARMRATGAAREPVDEAFIAPLVARSQAALGTAAFAASEAAGQALGYDLALSETRQWLERAE